MAYSKTFQISIRFENGYYVRFIREDDGQVACQLFDTEDNHISTVRETAEAFLRGMKLVAE